MQVEVKSAGYSNELTTTQRLPSPVNPIFPRQIDSKPNAIAIHVSRQKLFAGPVLVVAVWQISPHHERNLLLLQLLGSDLERIRHALDVDEHRSVATITVSLQI